ncbi:TetR/AcrR family transcriptional regulator (plasmid) [Ensifer adhaerens]|uniref:TetR/AcrR family transcriptional regulator n=1 Tax=Ensifer adhaerens TaxID=106592 RepID=UPI001CBB1782|nr:TetR/AcrR family transcriptional regulator [Ensifer adhaerens]MBZ7927187.1 TetR/AcrR family transcriptional regulator [Ensifer adhaerens]UAX98220.1 TetR/AcrR family transcriptional regulator [Ensifer adhaerens]UAY05602.1 TetR/AcrR family transcriptional regulator [Ensifer adhaerens]UAY12980.1 TetR/AcrR family transcriptional regulator [Ensifer adhaerens]
MTALPKRQQNRILRERRILDAALVVFSQKGFVSASMDDIAAEAGLTKPTLYQYFPSKDELFTAMMTEERDHMLESFEYPSASGMVAELYAFSWHYADVVLRPDMLNLARLIIGEAQRLPDVGRAYQASGPDRVLAGMIAYLERQRATGLIVFDDAELAAEDLWGLILSAPRNRALHIPDAVPDRATIERYIRNGLRVFLRAYSTAPDKDLAALSSLTPPPATATE